ncbi:MAG TPA: twin-arginine translocase TatA/TatE family subunit [Sphingomicrobium sp.]|nr:twin-arginine translocase TatA/TatE family subunit [Sphingomicrobium sp.]
MFGVDSIELIIVAIAALLFIGPKELPGAMRAAGRWVGKLRGMARHFSSGIEAVIREAELEEMDRKWREENERIMREHPMPEMMELSPAAEAQAYLERPDEPLLPLEAPAAPDDDPTPPGERPLP